MSGLSYFIIWVELLYLHRMLILCNGKKKLTLHINSNTVWRRTDLLEEFSPLTNSALLKCDKNWYGVVPYVCPLLQVTAVQRALSTVVSTACWAPRRVAREADVGFAPQTPCSIARTAYVKCVVEERKLHVRCFFYYFISPMSVTIPPVLHIHSFIHPSIILEVNNGPITGCNPTET